MAMENGLVTLPNKVFIKNCSLTRTLVERGTVGISIVSALILYAFPTWAQSSASQVREACEPILAASVTGSVDVATSSYDQSDVATWLCSANYQSKEEASHAGINVDAIVDGVVVGAMYSQDNKERSEARQKVCSTTSTNSESAYRSLVRQISRDPKAAKYYNQCVWNFLRSSQDLACMMSIPDGTKGKVDLNISYRQSITHTGKLASVSLQGATLPGGRTDMQKAISEFLHQDISKPVHPFGSHNWELDRVGTGSGSFSMSFDDGQQCDAKFEQVPAEASIAFTASGTSLRSNEGRQSFKIDYVKDCDDSSDDQTINLTAQPDQFYVTDQDILNQISIESSNCPRDASNVTAGKITSTTGANVNYSVRGCGYQNYLVARNCKGRGWLDAYGFVRTRSADPSKPTLHTYEDRRSYDTGSVELTHFPFVPALPRDFTLNDLTFVLSAKIPSYAAPGGANSIVLAGSAKGNPQPYPACQEFKVDGVTNSLAAIFSGQGIVTVVQRPTNCEGFKGAIQGIDSKVGSASPELLCANKLDGLPRMAKDIDPGAVTPPDVFAPWETCSR